MLIEMYPLNKIMPFFPLGICLFPGEDIPLRIFEPRYIQLINDCRKNFVPFAIPYMEKGGIQKSGSMVMLHKILATNSRGEMVIKVKGLDLIRILDHQPKMPGKLYAGGKIDIIPCNATLQDPELTGLISSYREKSKHPSFPDPENPETNLMHIAISLNMPSAEKFHFVQLDNKAEREAFLIARLKYLHHIKNTEQRLNNDFQMN